MLMKLLKPFIMRLLMGLGFRRTALREDESDLLSTIVRLHKYSSLKSQADMELAYQRAKCIISRRLHVASRARIEISPELLEKLKEVSDPEERVRIILEYNGISWRNHYARRPQ